MTPLPQTQPLTPTEGRAWWCAQEVSVMRETRVFLPLLPLRSRNFLELDGNSKFEVWGQTEGAAEGGSSTVGGDSF